MNILLFESFLIGDISKDFFLQIQVSICLFRCSISLIKFSLNLEFKFISVKLISSIRRCVIAHISHWLISNEFVILNEFQF